MAKATNTHTAYKSAITGRFVKPSTAKRHPDTTYATPVKKSK